MLIERRVLISLIFILISISALTVMYFHVFKHFRINSDMSVGLLIASDILHGNILLKQWTLPPDNFYTLDMPFVVLAVKCFGINTFTLRLVASFFYASVVTVIGFITFNFNKSMINKCLSLMVVFVFLLFPSPLLMPLITSMGSHAITTLYVILTFWLLSQQAFARCDWLRFILAFLLLTFANIGDPLAYFIGDLPLLIVSVVCSLRHKKNLIRFTMVLASLLTAHLIKNFIRAHGFIASPVNAIFASMEQFKANLFNWLTALLQVFNADFFGQPVSSYTAMLSVGYFLLLALAFIWVIKFVKKKAEALEELDSRDIFLMLLVVASACNILSCVFSTEYADPSSARYLFPTLLFISTFLASALPIFIRQRLVWIIGLFLFGVANATIFVIDSQNHIFSLDKQNVDYGTDNTLIKVERYLIAHHLTKGYASYWNASVIMIATNNALSVRAVDANAKGLIGPFAWLSKSSWYDPAPDNVAHFLIYDDSNFGNVNYQTAVKTFGLPSRQVTIDNQHILVWDKDITPLLSKAC